MTYWIGKQDHLIHQSRVAMVFNTDEVRLTDAEVSEMLKAQNKAVTPESIAEMRRQFEAMMNDGFFGKIFSEMENRKRCDC